MSSVVTKIRHAWIYMKASGGVRQGRVEMRGCLSLLHHAGWKCVDRVALAGVCVKMETDASSAWQVPTL